MVDMNALERQVAGEVLRSVGPVRPVDDLAIYNAVTAASRSQRWGFTMFSALRFMVAGVIVALFGGFLLAGIYAMQQGEEMAPAAVTESPSPMTTEAFLSTMVTEEVEPGVLRVIEDGYRGLRHPAEGCERVIVGDSDQVWRTTGCGQLFRLGQEGQWDYDQRLVDLGWGRSGASLDGRLWAIGDDSSSPSAPYYLRLFDDGEWVPDPRLSVGSGVGQIHVQDDGTVWFLGDAIYWAGDAPVEGEASAGSSSWGDVWTGEGDRDGVTLLSVTDDGVLWLMTETDAKGSVSFLRFDGTDWEVVPGPDGFDGAFTGVGFPAGVSPKGVLWMAVDGLGPHLSLARLDKEGWSTFTDADGVKPWGGQAGDWLPLDTLRVAPDGSVWVNASIATIHAEEGPGCDGLARFDGDTWQSFFPGSCISDLDFAPDGSVWVVAREGQGWETRTGDTYVITPEAVAGTE